MYLLTLNYSDSTTWFAGGFDSMDDLNRWLNEEMTRPYWKQDTTTTIVSV